MTVPHRTHPVRDPSPDNFVLASPPAAPTPRHSSDQLAARAIRLAVTGEGTLEENAAELAALAGDDILRLQRAKRRIRSADAGRSSTVAGHALAALQAAIELVSLALGPTPAVLPTPGGPTGSVRRRWPTDRW